MYIGASPPGGRLPAIPFPSATTPGTVQPVYSTCSSLTAVAVEKTVLTVGGGPSERFKGRAVKRLGPQIASVP